MPKLQPNPREQLYKALLALEDGELREARDRLALAIDLGANRWDWFAIVNGADPYFMP